MRDSPGPHLEKFLAEYAKSKTYQGVPIKAKSRRNQILSPEQRQRQESCVIIDIMHECLRQHFPDHPLLSAMVIFEPEHYPEVNLHS